MAEPGTIFVRRPRMLGEAEGGGKIAGVGIADARGTGRIQASGGP